MYAAQYEATLPDDYDLPAFRRRVAAAWHLLDDRAGLGLKAYLFADRTYTCFYLWRDTAAMSHFLFGGGGFERIVRGLGRLRVDHWTGVAEFAGPARTATPRAASRRTWLLSPDFDVAAEIAEVETLAQHPDVHTAALAIDPRDWRAVRFVLWRDEVHDDGQPFEIAHLSSPELDPRQIGLR